MNTVSASKRWTANGLHVMSWLTLALTAALVLRHDPLWWLALIASGLFACSGAALEMQPVQDEADDEGDTEDEEFESFLWEHGDLRDRREGER
ncbi:hypothetical protein [Streptomyces sp. NPDC050145]|uniref:hypothetical protein n=1 Tax=Streptomyces sp. NPDC050145 TaxID=3365602 RepID=UPI00379BEEC2